MRTVIVDDEPLMIKKFVRLSEGIPNLEIIGTFEYAQDVIAFSKNNRIDAAFLDIAMPDIDGIALACLLREFNPNILIVFITAYDNYIRDSNKIGSDAYIVKPYTREILENTMRNLYYLSARQRKKIKVCTFGRFTVKTGEKMIPLSGKTKEIIAILIARQGREVSNDELYSLIWENRPYGSTNMNVYYNALRRLKKILRSHHISELLISTKRGQMVDVGMLDCDYYEWIEAGANTSDPRILSFMEEYSWSEYILGSLVGNHEK